MLVPSVAFGAHLARIIRMFHFFARTLEAVKRNGLTIKSAKGNFTVIRRPHPIPGNLRHPILSSWL